jgi:hypothetical protein
MSVAPMTDEKERDQGWRQGASDCLTFRRAEKTTLSQCRTSPRAEHRLPQMGREIRLRYLPKPSLSRWILRALIDRTRVIEKMRADIPASGTRVGGHRELRRSADRARCRRHRPMRSKTEWPLDGKRQERAGKDRNPVRRFRLYRRNTDATAGDSRNVPPTPVSRR